MGNVLNNFVSAWCLERVIALALDLIICLTLAIIPMFGPGLSLLYFLIRDGLPVKQKSGFGKSIYNLHVVSAGTRRRAPIGRIVVRNVMLLVPLLNLYDIWCFVSTGERLADKWTNTEILKTADGS